MSLIRMHLPSKALGREVALNVILPLPTRADIPVKPLPTLYLLHGLGDDHTSWQRKTSIERYALEAGLAVIMPDGAMSCYENMVHGQDYKTFIGEELPEIMCKLFPLSRRREDTFIAGCSMGGCGAMKLGLNYSECFSAIGCLSAGHREYRSDSPLIREVEYRAYGDHQDATEAENEAKALRLSKGAQSIRIWMGWGTDDALKDTALHSKAFFDAITSDSLTVEYTEIPGTHDWALWDELIRMFISRLTLPKPDTQCM